MKKIILVAFFLFVLCGCDNTANEKVYPTRAEREDFCKSRNMVLEGVGDISVRVEDSYCVDNIKHCINECEYLFRELNKRFKGTDEPTLTNYNDSIPVQLNKCVEDCINNLKKNNE